MVKPLKFFRDQNCKVAVKIWAVLKLRILKALENYVTGTNLTALKFE